MCPGQPGALNNLYSQFVRTTANDNRMSFEGRKLQLQQG